MKRKIGSFSISWEMVTTTCRLLTKPSPPGIIVSRPNTTTCRIWTFPVPGRNDSTDSTSQNHYLIVSVSIFTYHSFSFSFSCFIIFFSEFYIRVRWIRKIILSFSIFDYFLWKILVSCCSLSAIPNDHPLKISLTQGSKISLFKKHSICSSLSKGSKLFLDFFTSPLLKSIFFNWFFTYPTGRWQSILSI